MNEIELFLIEKKKEAESVLIKKIEKKEVFSGKLYKIFDKVYDKVADIDITLYFKFLGDIIHSRLNYFLGIDTFSAYISKRYFRTEQEMLDFELFFLRYYTLDQDEEFIKLYIGAIKFQIAIVIQYDTAFPGVEGRMYMTTKRLIVFGGSLFGKCPSPGVIQFFGVGSGPIISGNDRNFFGTLAITIIGVSDIIMNEEGVSFNIKVRYFDKEKDEKFALVFSPINELFLKKYVKKKDFESKVKQEEIESFYQNICKLNNIN